jgi:site-specific DNA recombinase
VWNRQRTDSDLVDPANTGLGHRQVQWWNLPSGRVLFAKRAPSTVVQVLDMPDGPVGGEPL